jgi:DNA replication protein DnaC
MNTTTKKAWTDFSEEFHSLAKFNTLGDHQRQKLLDGATEMANAIANHGTPYSLALLGNSGTGKTHLAGALLQWARKKAGHFWDDNGIIHPSVIWYFSAMDACTRFLGGDYELPHTMQKANFLVIDDLGTERDPRASFRGEMQHLVDRRLGRGWTVITSNFTFQQLLDYDTRLASRLIRSGGKVVYSTADDYCLTLLKNGTA